MKKLLLLIVLLFPSICLADLSGRLICVDAGHGGADIGAPGIDGSSLPNEADLVMDIANRFKGYLDHDQASVLLTRNDDLFVSLANRVALANNYGADVFMSIHLNSATSAAAHGTETFAYSANSVGFQLASEVQAKLLTHLQRRDRGVKTASFYVLSNTLMPAELSEGLFVSNQDDLAVIAQESGRQAHALALYEGICAFYNQVPNGGAGTETGSTVLKGFVYDDSSGQGNVQGNRLAGAQCDLQALEGDGYYQLTSDSSGLFSFADVALGSYTFTVALAGYETASRTIYLNSSEVSWASTGLQQESIVGQQSSLHGFVYNRTNSQGDVPGNRLANASCILSSPDASPLMVTANDDGLFRFDNLAAGLYQLTVSAENYESNSLQVTIGMADDVGQSIGLLRVLPTPVITNMFGR